MAEAKPIERIYLIVHPGFSKGNRTYSEIAAGTGIQPVGRMDLNLLVRYQRAMQRAATGGHLVILVEPKQKSPVPGFSRRQQRLVEYGSRLLGKNFLSVPETAMDFYGAPIPKVKAFLEAHALAPKVTVIGMGEYLNSCVHGEVEKLANALKGGLWGVRSVRAIVDARHGKFEPGFPYPSMGLRYKKRLKATPRRPRKPRPR